MATTRAVTTTLRGSWRSDHGFNGFNGFEERPFGRSLLIEGTMSKNGKLSMTPKAKEAADRHSVKAFGKALRLNKFGPQIETQIADLCREAWAAGYFYAKQELEND